MGEWLMCTWTYSSELLWPTVVFKTRPRGHFSTCGRQFVVLSGLIPLSLTPWCKAEMQLQCFTVGGGCMVVISSRLPRVLILLHNHSDKLTAEWIGNEATGDRIGLFEKSGSANWNWIENIPTEAKLWKSVLMRFLKTDEKCQEHE